MKNKIEGITLIALVVTIVVLLILAGITINLIYADGGIIAKANQAQEAQGKAQVVDIIQTMLADYQIEKVVDGVELEDYLNEQKTAGNLDNVNPNSETITVELNGFEVEINKNSLNIISAEETVGVTPEVDTAMYQINGDPIVEGETYEEIIVTVKVENEESLGTIDSIVMKDENDLEIDPEPAVVGEGIASFRVNRIGNYTITVMSTTDGVEKAGSVQRKFEQGGILGVVSGLPDEQTKTEVVDIITSQLLPAYQVDNAVYGTKLIDYFNNSGSVDKVTDNGDGTITVELRGVKVTIRESDLEIVSAE